MANPATYGADAAGNCRGRELIDELTQEVGAHLLEVQLILQPVVIGEGLKPLTTAIELVGTPE